MMDKNQKRKQDRSLRKILNQANYEAMKVASNSNKVYSAEEALDEKAKRDKKAGKNKPPLMLDGSHLKTKESAASIALHDAQLEMLVRFSEPIHREQQDMELQAMRYIIGPRLDFPLDKMQRLFGWQRVSRHPITDVLLKDLEKFQVFYYWGDKASELLENKRNHVALIWQKTELPEFRTDKKGNIIGLINNWQYLFDDDAEYEGDQVKTE